jgi:hypothetical protein
MSLIERVGNLHMHTTLSDGVLDHAQVARAAEQAGLDFVVVTDHNVYAPEAQGWYGRTLVLVGEELHDPAHPHVNHLLVLGAGRELRDLAPNTAELAAAVAAANAGAGGLAFIAHPYEHSGAYAREPEINWVAWHVTQVTGLEIWNYMSEFKSHLAEPLGALLYALCPRLAIRGPFPETLARWDALLATRRTVAIGGSDAHGTVYRMGPIKLAVFSHAHLFRALNTHVLVEEDWTGDAERDAGLLLDALGRGRAFIGYDGLAPTRGFQFYAEGRDQHVEMGDTLAGGGTFRLVVTTPAPARIRLMLNGHCVAEASGSELTHSSRAPGAYRVEVYRPWALRPRCWILSNPIYRADPPRPR